MPDIITIGSALVDIFVHSKDFQLQNTDQGVVLCQQYGDKVEVDSFQVFGGGGGTNTAVGFQRLGFPAAVVAEMGTDSVAQLVLSELEAEKIETQWLVKEKKEQTGGSVILVGPDGGRTVMVHRGAASQLDLSDIPFADLAKARWIHLSSIGGKPDILQKIFQTVAEHERGLSWNPGKAELQLLSDGQIPAVTAHILLLNQEEWEMVASKQEWLLQQIPVIVVTKGKEGGRILTQGHEYFYQSVPVTSVDDTGAGDAFAVGFISAGLLGKDIITAARWGSLNAAQVVQKVGAKPGLLGRAELETMVAQAN